ncbi:hypothetical protein [Streptomonospora litoralis]|nr:hypothetical protein [Streptomonospora litoralis]
MSDTEDPAAPAVTYTPGGGTYPYTISGLRMTAPEAIAYLAQRGGHSLRDAGDAVALARVDACNAAQPTVDLVGDDEYRIDGPDGPTYPRELAAALLIEEYRRTEGEAARLLDEARDRATG